MKSAFAFAALPALLLAAGCNKGGDTTANTAIPSAPSGSIAAVAAPAGQNWVDTVAKTTDGGYLMGNPAAPLKLVEYGSRTCPHCAKFDAEDFPKLKANYIASGKVSYEFRDFPVHDTLDMAPIILGRCVDPATFFPMLDQMMANQDKLLGNFSKVDQSKFGTMSPSQVTTSLAQQLGYLDFVKQRGLPEAQAMKCLNDPAGYTAIASETAKANSQYNISSTPTFILNGKVVDEALGVDPWVSVENALKSAGA